MKVHAMMALTACLLFGAQLQAQGTPKGGDSGFNPFGESRQDEAQLDDDWVVVAKFTDDGKRIATDDHDKKKEAQRRLIFSGEMVTFESPDVKSKTYKLAGVAVKSDPFSDNHSQTRPSGPQQFAMVTTSGPAMYIPGILELKKDTLRICFGTPTGDPKSMVVPKEFRGAGAFELQREGGGRAMPERKREIPAKKDSVADDHELFQGTWVFDTTSYKGDGNEKEDERRMQLKITIADRTLILQKSRDQGDEATYSLGVDPSGPKTIDLVLRSGPDKGKRILGRYFVSFDLLKLTLGRPDGPRPGHFGDGEWGCMLRRDFNVDKKAAPAPSQLSEANGQSNKPEPIDAPAGHKKAGGGPSLSALSQLLGKNIKGKELQAFRDSMAAGPTAWVTRDPGGPYTYCQECPSKGISLEFNPDHTLRVVWLYSKSVLSTEYVGELPARLSFADTRADVERKLGGVKREGGGAGYYVVLLANNTEAVILMLSDRESDRISSIAIQRRIQFSQDGKR